ncbi:hypothetical protein HOG48_01830 [Candidatus Peregrinibacteria bacterium]|jgi:hypothetical protein|nr:hypothetical protein [Candidatus Peregrinibacteria bacterium]
MTDAENNEPLEVQEGTEAAEATKESLPSEIAEVSADTRSRISEAISTADLIEQVKAMDVNNMTAQETEGAFEKLEGGIIEGEDELKAELGESALTNIALKEQFTKKELVEKLLDFTPKGPFRLKITPFSINIHFLNPIDWLKIRGSIKEATTSGYSGQRIVDLNGEEKKVEIAIRGPQGGASTDPHETRHAITRFLVNNPSIGKFELDLDEELDKPQQIDSLSEQVAKMLRIRLKDEIASFIEGGAKSIYS